GARVHFRSDVYPPTGPAGLFVLAHEVAHAREAPADPASPRLIGSPRAPEETAANRAAHAALAGERALAPFSSGAATGVVRRFTGPEHEQIAAEASNGAKTTINLGTKDAPDPLTFSEMVALAGDWFRSLDEMNILAASEDGRAQMRWARWRALGIGAEPAVSDAVKKAVMDRYYSLAAANVSHFSAGGTARDRYHGGHEAALRLAFMAGVNRSPAAFEDARTREAFTDHFLTDMFSAGHVRTPRADIRSWYIEHFPDSVDKFVHYMAAQMVAFLKSEHPIGNLVGAIPSESEVAARVHDIGGEALKGFSLGDVVSLAFHNFDNQGLGVVTDADAFGKPVPGGKHFRGLGDAMIGKPKSPREPDPGRETRELAVAAVRASLQDLDKMHKMGLALPSRPVHAPGPPPDFETPYRQALAQLVPFAAEAFIPREDPTAGNLPLVWQWGKFNQDMRKAVDDAVHGNVVPVLREKASQNTDPNVRAALNAFANRLDRLKTTAIEEAMGGAKAGP
ncbi:MAG TPA: hypothetical protein VI456_00460, partial [Polyangia bacterium]